VLVKVACVGGGPAGLYFSILMKLQDPSHEVTVHERDPEGSTYGWGVTYWAGLLEKLHEGDPVSARAVREASVCWSGGLAYVGGGTTAHEGDEGFGIGRHRLLALLGARAADLGVRIVRGRAVTELSDLGDADLVVAADGVRSALRRRYTGDFGSRVALGRNRYAWLGTTKVFDAFTFAFVATEHGWIWCYGYRYDEDRSTFVVECGPATWTGLGLDRLGPDEGLDLLAGLFAKPLDGHGLSGRADAGGGADWLAFRTLTNRAWYRGNLVLLGDAAHTTHYSIGAGTTLALEDALALAKSLRGLPEGAPGGDPARLAPALAAYERERRAALLPVQSAARYSAQWYENLPRYLALPPDQMFALLGQRHSPLLPLVPPRVYYRLDRLATRLEPVRTIKRSLGPRIAGALYARRG
jgi:2-polyprenyl-6-methoxyphenol hydroxylase-like FAD-dependent oxidoreductase